MPRYRFPTFVTANAPRYLVVWDMHWALIECQRFEPSADLSAAIRV